MNRFLRLIYTLVLIAYQSIIWIVSPFKSKAKKWIVGRQNWQTNLQNIRKNHTWIWFHCASLGEYEDCLEVFLKIKDEFPTHKVLLSVFSPSAYEVLKHSNPFDALVYLPIDTPQNSSSFIQILNPSIAFFGRSEIWVNYMYELKKQNIPCFLISLKMNEKSGFLKGISKRFYYSAFQSFSFIYCQDQLTKNLLAKQFNLTNSLVSRNTRYERIWKEKRMNTTFDQVEKFVKTHFTIVVGSCLLADEKIILKLVNNPNLSHIRWIIVPHEIFESKFRKEVWKNNETVYYSDLSKGSQNKRILVVDQVGILKHLYKYGSLALVGGGFNKIGIHNIIEAAIYGLRIGIGPNHKNYQEALDLIELKACFIYNTEQELESQISQEISYPMTSAHKHNIIQSIENQSNTSEFIIQDLQKRLNLK